MQLLLVLHLDHLRSGQVLAPHEASLLIAKGVMVTSNGDYEAVTSPAAEQTVAGRLLLDHDIQLCAKVSLVDDP